MIHHDRHHHNVGLLNGQKIFDVVGSFYSLDLLEFHHKLGDIYENPNDKWNETTADPLFSKLIMDGTDRHIKKIYGMYSVHSK